MNAVLDYLRIPDDYDGNRYSLSWSASGDAIDRPDGSTFAFVGEIALFLEGYTLTGPLIHFSYILYLLERFDSKLVDHEEPGLPRFGPGRELVERSDSLARAFRDAGSPHRNAGALCAWLCRDIPPVVAPPDSQEVCLRLRLGSIGPVLAARGETTVSIDRVRESPPLTAIEFDMRFLNALRELTTEVIASWLEHGRGPLPFEGDRVAETVEALKPKTLEGVLAALEDRERLADALPMVAQFLSALTLPPRRLAHHALPTGGYADVATRGRPEQILPSQFAIDNIEFLRRFAENELLYFHREEPHVPSTEDLVLLLDQGVRTWGKVRHALAASALALARLSGRKQLRLLLTSTGVEGLLFDPLTTNEEALGSLWESSDLSPNPGQALEQVLETQGEGRRDLFVLSHPRNVAEPSFAVSARQIDDTTRLFTVAIDESGSVQFSEWRRGVPVKLAAFRVDFKPQSMVRKKPPRQDLGHDPWSWRGDVEPIPFPFRFGVTQRIERPLFDFDDSSRWLLLCTPRGILHAWKIDGSAAEILPRGMFGESVLEQVDAVIGVADGFVVGGRVGKWLVAMHYDLASRTARSYSLGPNFDGEWEWFYFRELHTVVARGKDDSRAVDISNREIHRSRDSESPPSLRASRAFEMASDHFIPPPKLPIVDEGTPEPLKGGFLRLERSTGNVHLERVVPAWQPFNPTADGRPMLKNCWVESAQWRGNVLALVVSSPSQRTLLRVFQSHQPFDGGQPLVATREWSPSSNDPSSMILSHDGRLIARRLGERQIEVREVAGTGQQVFTTVKGKVHNAPSVTLGRYGMQIHVGKHISLIRWDHDKLTVSTVAEDSTRSEIDIVTWPLDRPATRSTPLPKAVQYDPSRFVACARAELTAVVDIFGQVSLFDSKERLIAMFIAFRSQVAAWTPDGTRFGPSHEASPLFNGPATRNAAEIIGRILKEASDARIILPAVVKEANPR
jgi:MoxR-vWA-beta-propeller ternary system domain bpX1